jgi:hypothetical protein
MQNGGLMSESKILPTILIILPSSVFLLSHRCIATRAARKRASTAEMIEDCPRGTILCRRATGVEALNRKCSADRIVWGRGQKSIVLLRDFFHEAME